MLCVLVEPRREDCRPVDRAFSRDTFGTSAGNFDFSFLVLGDFGRESSRRLVFSLLDDEDDDLGDLGRRGIESMVLFADSVALREF